MKNSKKFSAVVFSACIMAFSFQSNAKASDFFFKPYVGLNGNLPTSNQDKLSGGALSGGSSSYKGLNDNYGIHIGAKFHERLAVEVGYEKFGMGFSDFVNEGENFSTSYFYKYRYYDLKLFQPIFDKSSVKGSIYLVGGLIDFTSQQGTAIHNATGIEITQTENPNKLYYQYGIGANFDFGKYIGVDLFFKQMNLAGSEKIDRVGAALHVYFA